jgi:hypothetical protein
MFWLAAVETIKDAAGDTMELLTLQNSNPLTLLPLALTGGLYRHSPITPGITTNITPDTPLLAGKPTLNANSPE